MSFEINGPTPIKRPSILEAQNMQNNGGGGNLGYMKRRKDDKKKKEEVDVFLTSKDEEDEVVNTNEDIPKNSLWEQVSNYAKKWFKQQ